MKLIYFSCTGNQIKGLLDLSENQYLELLNCGGNKIKVLDISGCLYIEELDVSNMPALQAVFLCEGLIPLQRSDINSMNSPNVRFESGCKNIDDQKREKDIIDLLFK